MITKKYFKEIAEILKRHAASNALIEDFCNFLYRINNRFDRNRFINAIKE